MAKRISAKIEVYEKDGQQKGKYVNIGVIMSNENGEYVMLNPTVDLSGVLLKQRLMNPDRASGSVMCSVFDSNQSNPQPGGGTDSSDIPFSPLDGRAY